MTGQSRWVAVDVDDDDEIPRLVYISISHRVYIWYIPPEPFLPHSISRRSAHVMDVGSMIRSEVGKLFVCESVFLMDVMELCTSEF